MKELIYSIVAASIISSITILILSFYNFIKRYLNYLLAFTTGVFLGAFFLNALPNLVEKTPKEKLHIIFLVIFVSFFIFYLIENFLHFHHHGEQDHKHKVGILNLIGDFFHNFIDGLAIISAFKISPEFGIMISLAIAAHEIPQEFGDFSILIYSGFNKFKAVLLNFLVGLSSILGVLVGYFTQIPTYYLIAIVAGSFLYIGASDLIPLLHKNSKNLKEKIINILLFISGAIFIKSTHLIVNIIKFLIK